MQISATPLHSALRSAKPDMYTSAKKILGATNAKVKDFDISKMLDNRFVDNARSRNLAK